MYSGFLMLDYHFLPSIYDGIVAMAYFNDIFYRCRICDVVIKGPSNRSDIKGIGSVT